MKGFLEIDLETNFEQLVSDLNATEPQVKAAMRSTLGKMATWLKGKSARGLSKELNVPLGQLRRRLKGFNGRHNGVTSIRLWYGLDPINMIYLGRPVKTSSGVTVRGRRIKGAFVRKGIGENNQVFKRKPEASNATGLDSKGRPRRNRLPLKAQTLDIDEKAQVYIEDEIIGAAEFENKFFSLFEHELKWRTQTPK